MGIASLAVGQQIKAFTTGHVGEARGGKSSNMKACQLPLRRLSISKRAPKGHQFNHHYPKWNVWFLARGYWRFCGTQNVALHCGGYRSNKRTGRSRSCD